MRNSGLEDSQNGFVSTSARDKERSELVEKLAMDLDLIANKLGYIRTHELYLAEMDVLTQTNEKDRFISAVRWAALAKKINNYPTPEQQIGVLVAGARLCLVVGDYSSAEESIADAIEYAENLISTYLISPNRPDYLANSAMLNEVILALIKIIGI